MNTENAHRRLPRHWMPQEWIPVQWMALMTSLRRTAYYHLYRTVTL
jgi:hypothetical protein